VTHFISKKTREEKETRMGNKISIYNLHRHMQDFVSSSLTGLPRWLLVAAMIRERHTDVFTNAASNY
jgi:hypothetical protein